jgi:hypothetical protein
MERGVLQKARELATVSWASLRPSEVAAARRLVKKGYLREDNTDYRPYWFWTGKE